MNIREYVKGYKDLKDFSVQLKARLADDWDIVGALSGEEGVGKTTLMVLLGFLVDNNGFNLEKNIAYLPSEKEIVEKFKSLKPKSCFGVDEAAKSLYKLRWMDKLQVAINQMYMTERWQNKATFMCMPRFTDLNEYFRNHRVKVWIHIIERGFAIAFLRDDLNPFVDDPWYLKRNAKVINDFRIKRKKRLIDVTREEKEFLLKKTTNFFFAFTFPKLPEKMEERVRKLRDESRKKEKDPKIEERNKAIRKLVKQGVKHKVLAKAYGISIPRINQIVHSVEL